ncbi:MAG: DUF1499 domain-containing protein [Gammaproteobacteria bacterium]|jgi:uncharacterized protein (DUF1499 family)|nr:DUF1499 domain-containing protein [Gammaproteobacteria bacterium]HJO10609.1 DUF1499 domain-containing protein [Gammaproteobacteria bacterium]|tara:strand:- start:4091 stop:4504 length:414 start_codon:yes stop_codon:yes gene_type:complete
MKKSVLSMIPLLTACAGEPPQNIGIQSGRLAACPDSPNCVSSFETGETHGIDPLAATLSDIERVLLDLDEANIVNAGQNYLHAEFTSRIMGYVDDVEFLYDAASSVTHVRSASRLGYSDMGANRKRIEAIRSALATD